jgi:two-component system C4-dicarboxylate transport sensor histidine kinase DctB
MGSIAGIADRMIHITQQLRNFSQRGKTTNASKAPVDINQAIAHAQMLLSDRLKAQDVELITPSESLFIMGDSVHIEQVFTNLFANALDAMQYHQADGAHHITVHWQAMPNHPNRVEITVQDTGPGISASETKHLFDPFFTNKPDGKGLGLGLSIVATIIAEHGGTIVVWPASAPPCGATFVFDLPRV